MSIKKKLFKSSFLIIAATFINKFLLFMLLPVYTSTFSIVQFGEIQLVLGIGVFLRIFTQFGINTTYFKMESRGRDKNTLALSSIVFQEGLEFFLLLIVVIAGSLYQFITIELLFLYLSSFVFRIIFDVSLLRLRLEQNYKSYFIFSVLSSVLTISLMYLALTYGGANLHNVFKVYIVASVLVAIPLLRPILAHCAKMNWLETKSDFKEIFRNGFPLMMSNIVLAFFFLQDKLLLKFFGLSTELGLYSYYLKFSELINAFLISIINIVFSPLRWTMFKKEDGAKRISLYISLLSEILIGFYFLSLPVLLILMHFITLDPSYLSEVHLLFVMLLSTVIYGIYVFNVNSLQLVDKEKSILKIALFGSILGFVLTYFMTKYLGLIGTVFSTLISNFALLTMAFLFRKKHFFHQSVNSVHIFKVLAMVVVALAMFFFLIMGDVSSMMIFYAGISFLLGVAILIRIYVAKSYHSIIQMVFTGVIK